MKIQITDNEKKIFKRLYSVIPVGILLYMTGLLNLNMHEDQDSSSMGLTFLSLIIFYAIAIPVIGYYWREDKK